MQVTAKKQSRSFVHLSDNTCWPAVNGRTRALAGRVRQQFDGLDRSDFLVLAAMAEAYIAIVDGPQYLRNAQAQAIRRAENIGL